MTTILTKKKDSSGVPATADITSAVGGAELAVNTADKRLLMNRIVFILYV